MAEAISPSINWSSGFKPTGLTSTLQRRLTIEKRAQLRTALVGLDSEDTSIVIDGSLRAASSRTAAILIGAC